MLTVRLDRRRKKQVSQLHTVSGHPFFILRVFHIKLKPILFTTQLFVYVTVWLYKYIYKYIKQKKAANPATNQTCSDSSAGFLFLLHPCRQIQ